MTQIKILYSCVVCGKGYDKRQSLAAHMKVHKDVEFFRTTVRVPKVLWKQFLGVCEKHKTTTCHVLYTLMKATVKGDETGLVDLAAKNPLIVQMQSFFGARPRGRGKYRLRFRGEPNFYNIKGGFWEFREGEPLNAAGHVMGCHCLWCH